MEKETYQNSWELLTGNITHKNKIEINFKKYITQAN